MRAVALVFCAACGGPFAAERAELGDAAPSADVIAPDVATDAGVEAAREAAADVAPPVDAAGEIATADARDGDPPADGAADAACSPEPPDSYACGLNMLPVTTPAHVCLLDGSDQATEASVPAACQCAGDFTCACLLASGAFCAQASCSTGSGHPIIRGCS